MGWTAPPLAIFDVDGTLIDSQASIVAAMTAAYHAVGLPPPSVEAIRHIVGLSLAEAVLILSPERDEATRTRLAQGYRDAFAAAHRDGEVLEPLFPGIVAALDRVEAAGVLLGVATGKSRSGLDMVLAQHGLTGRFVTLQTSDIHPSKPNPAMVLAALRETGADAATAVLIGDTSHDVLMGKAARVWTVGVAWGFHEAAGLTAAGADVVIDDTADLADAVLRLLRVTDGARESA
jgi:phosphoglycolate phosphatase